MSTTRLLPRPGVQRARFFVLYGGSMSNSVTIVDVANKAGVAISSVSAALNDRPGVSDQTRKRIFEAIDTLGWVPSVRGRGLSGKRAFALGLILQRAPHILEVDPFYGGFIGGIGAVLETRGQALVLQLVSQSDRALPTYRRYALEHRVDGVFLSDIELHDERIPLLAELGLPAVTIDADADEETFPSVRQDHREGMERLIDHLVGLGHRRIAHVSGSPELIHSAKRIQYWRSAVERAGLQPGPLVAGDFTWEGGARAASGLMGLDDPPTAVVCANDLTAIGFIARASDLGFRVPYDVSVTGDDGISLGAFNRPPLTTLKAEPYELGRQAAMLLLSAIAGGRPDDVEIAPAQLIVRQSTAPPPHRI
jgi:DNA-binding LacI/PurR family transcriptional regulator